MGLDTGPEDVSVLLASVIERSRFLAKSKTINLKIDINRDPSVVQLDVDAARITQVFANLVSNAVRYSPAGSDIEVTLDRRQRFTRFRVYNEGTGVNREELKMVAHPYFRGTNTGNSPEPGSGIGLTLATAIVESHGGHMKLRSDPDEFFEVEVLLPNPNPD